MNTTDFILSEIRTALATEASFSVLSIKKDSEKQITCYPFIDGNTLLEINRKERGTERAAIRPFSCVVGIRFEFKQSEDTLNAGTGTTLYGNILADCKRVVRTLNNSLPKSNTDTDFKCQLLECTVVGDSGYFDDGRDVGEFDVTLQVVYNESDV